MTWATFYLICFVVGFAFSVLSLVAGTGKIHLPGGLHLPHGGLRHRGGASHHPVSHPAVVDSHAVARGLARTQSSQISFFNIFTLMAFLAWFGGTGYLLTQYSNLWFLLALGFASLSGLAGASVVFFFFAKVLLAHETILNPADFELQGILGRVTSSIREGGTGEITFSQAGTRRTCGARSEEGAAISKGSEVVITRYERGIAYVRRWEDMTQ
jgi:membrane protein implicated in regulation of membrane protease activity